MVFTCSMIFQLFFESLGLGITSGIFNLFKNGSNIPFFLSMKESYKQKVNSCGYTFDQNSFTNSNHFFEPCSNWILSIFLSKINLRSFSNLLIFTNLRYLPLRNESTRAPSCTICIINPSPVPQTMSSSGTEQTMSSQEHPDFYILEKMVDVRIHS